MLRAQGAFGTLKKVASLRDPCPESPKMVGYTFYFMRPCPKPPKGGSGHEIKCVADHFGGFRAWIPERSDFFKGPKRAPINLAPGPPNLLQNFMPALHQLCISNCVSQDVQEHPRDIPGPGAK